MFVPFAVPGIHYTCLCSNVFHVVICHVAEYASSFIRRPKIWLFLVLEHRKTGKWEIHATSHLPPPPTNILSVESGASFCRPESFQGLKWSTHRESWEGGAFQIK